jgi:hypothetical protein
VQVLLAPCKTKIELAGQTAGLVARYSFYFIDLEKKKSRVLQIGMDISL